MNRISHFALLMALLLTVLVGYRFYDYAIGKNFTIDIYTDCNPAEHSCFLLEDLDMGYGIEDGPYERVSIVSKHAPACLEEHSCEDFTCEGLPEESCTITYCSEDTVGEGEVCIHNDMTQE
jgi:hypothetical protein